MDKAKALLDQYNLEHESSQAAEESDRSRKTQIIAALEELGCDQRVAEFLARVAVDDGEYDLARIEALKVFQVLECTDGQVRQLIANAICTVLNSSKNNDVRNYAAMAGIEYLDFSQVRDALFRILANVHEDVDLRWNAFPVLERIGSSLETIEIARSILNEDEFKQSAARVLTEWKVK